MHPIIWEHAPIVIPADLQQVKLNLDKMEPDGWELTSMVPLVLGSQPTLDQNGVLQPGQQQSAFLMVFKRPAGKESAVEKAKKLDPSRKVLDLSAAGLEH